MRKKSGNIFCRNPWLNQKTLKIAPKYTTCNLKGKYIFISILFLKWYIGN